MTIIPVIDLLNGVVVRGVAGNRQQYQPIRSQLTPSTHPVDVAQALRNRTGTSTLYVADLDAILHRNPNITIWKQLQELGFELILDAGLRSSADLSPELMGVHRVVLALESIVSPEEFGRLAEAIGPERCLLGLDLRQGKLTGEFQHHSIDGVLTMAADCQISQVLILDVADVGVYAGGSTHDHCREVRMRFPNWKVIAGGGVRGYEDLRAWQAAGADAVLVASALHDGLVLQTANTSLEVGCMESSDRSESRQPCD